MTNLKRNEKPASRSAGLRAALSKMQMLAEDGALKPYRYEIKPPTLMPGVVPDGVQAPVLAMDGNPCYSGQNYFGGIDNLTGFPGYPYLSQLTTRAEYRAFASALSTELTREWIEFGSKDDTDDTDNKDKIKAIEEEFERLDVRNVIRQSCEHDCYFGRAQIFVDIDGADRKTPLIIHKATVPKGSLKRIKTVEAIWTTPTAYNALDPAAPDFYNPSKWFMLGQEVHASRLLTMITRPVADMLKPAFNFGGISLSQLAEPYVDNWLVTRQSVSDLIKNFSITVLATSMEQDLQGDTTGQSLLDRVKLFLAHKNNRNVMLVDKETEELVQVNTPLSGLSELQAQSQEHMCAVGRMPAIVLTGLSPTGLNASSDGEIRVFYDWIAAQQEAFYYQPINTVFQLVQLSLFGEIDPNLTFRFIPLFQLTGKEEAEIRTADGATDCAYVTASVLAPEEVRGKLARDPKSGYLGLDVGKLPVPPEGPGDGEPPEGMKDDAATANDAEFNESDHPRATNGEFGAGGRSGSIKKDNGGVSSAIPAPVKDDIALAIMTADVHNNDDAYMDAWEKAGHSLDDFTEPGILKVLEQSGALSNLSVNSVDPMTINNDGRATSPQFVERYKNQLSTSEAPPIIVKNNPDGGLSIVEGGHRLAAAKAAKSANIKVVNISDLLKKSPDELFEKSSIAKDHIVEEGGKFKLMSHDGKNLGEFDTREAAEKHERQVNYFKSQG